MTVQRATTRTRSAGDSEANPVRQSTRRRLMGAICFFGLSLALPVAAFASSAPPAVIPFILALGPAFIALALAYREGAGAVGRLVHTLTIRPPRRRWYLVLLIPVLWAMATIVAAVALGEPTVGLFDAVFPAILVIPLVVLVPAFTEELAWRGYALPRLMTVMSPLIAAFVLAIPWTLIHVLLFMPGQFNGDLEIWPGVVSLFAYSVLLTWVFIRTGGSVLMTALVHTGLNGVAPLMGGLDPDNAWVIRNVLAALIAITIIAQGGFRGSRTRPSPQPLTTQG